jgi:GTP-binding protein Era
MACVLVINKIDKVPKLKLLPMLQKAQELYTFAAMVPISAENDDGVDIVLAEVAKLMPEGEALFEDDVFTDQTERDLCSEMIREQLILKTRQELPHSVAVTVERFDEARRSGDRPIVEIDATIWVERTGQKPIVIGAEGKMIKAIGTSARTRMEKVLDAKVMLRLEVDIAKDWSDDPRALTRFGIQK